MTHEKRLSIPDARVVAGLSLVSIGLFVALGIAAGEHAVDALVLGVRMYVMASNTVVGLLSHGLGQLVLAVVASWALMAGAGVWILWRMTHPTIDGRNPHEATHGN